MLPIINIGEKFMDQIDRWTRVGKISEDPEMAGFK